MDTFITDPKHPAISIMNEMEYNIIVPGTQELSIDMNLLSGIFGRFKGDILAANVYNSSGNKYFEENKIITKEGIKIGITGVTAPINNISGGVKITDPIPEVRQQVNVLKAKGADAIILVAHINVEQARIIAKEVPGIDIILLGSNQLDISKEIAGDTIITEPYKEGMAFSVIDLMFTSEGGKVTLVRKDSRTIRVAGEDSEQGIEVIYNAYHRKLRENINEVLGETKEDLLSARLVKGVPEYLLADSGLSSYIAEAELYYTKADVVVFSFVNDKETSIAKGSVSKKDIMSVYGDPGEEMSVYEMTGKDLKDFMEWSTDYFNQVQQGSKEYTYNKPKLAQDNTFKIFGGLKYEINMLGSRGERIRWLTLISTGRRITDSTALKVAMSREQYEILVQKGGPLEGRNIKRSAVSYAVSGVPSTAESMLSDYTVNVKKGIIPGRSNGNWKVTGIR